MKYKICKMLMVIFTLCFLYGCDKKFPSDTAKTIEKQNSEKNSEVTKSIISQSKLTSKESFYLNALSYDDNPVAFDAVWDQDFHLFTYKIYNFEDNNWHEVTKGSYKLEDKMAWIVVGTKLTELHLSIGDGKSSYEKNETTSIKSLDNYSADQAVLQKIEIEIGKEIPAVAYREFGGEEAKKADFSDFANPDQVVMSKDERYLMLTFMFE